MPVKLGVTSAGPDAAGLLLDCHGRIRSFTDVALRLAGTQPAPDAEVADAARRVKRYFERALPLHVQDEEQSLEPRLRGRDVAVDRALDLMQREHQEHAPALARLIALCGALEHDPARRAATAGELSDVASDLQRQFERHLQREEQVILPAIAKVLGPAVGAQILAEIRARRAGDV
jgi:iron-sulfur cluster repair protein YtfE (RIC family)